MCSGVAVMLSRCSLSLSLSPSSWGCQGALVCAGRPRGLVLEAFLQQTRQQASVFESSLELLFATPRNDHIWCNVKKCFCDCLIITKWKSAGCPRGLVLEAFLQQTRQQASIFISSLEIVLCNPKKCPNLCASSLHFCYRAQYLNLLETF